MQLIDGDKFFHRILSKAHKLFIDSPKLWVSVDEVCKGLKDFEVNMRSPEEIGNEAIHKVRAYDSVPVEAIVFVKKLKNNPHLWFYPSTWGEALLQLELRKLMAVIRGEDPDKIKVWGEFGIKPRQ